MRLFALCVLALSLSGAAVRVLPKKSVVGTATPDEVVFVSSNRWDDMGAASFGFRPVWVNRAQMPDEYPHHQPAHIVPNLSALPDLPL